MSDERRKIFEQLEAANKRSSELKGMLNRAKSDLFCKNKPTNPTIFARWQTELAEVGRRIQRLQFELGEANGRSGPAHDRHRPHGSSMQG
jgi:hypothetical protein